METDPHPTTSAGCPSSTPKKKSFPWPVPRSLLSLPALGHWGFAAMGYCCKPTCSITVWKTKHPSTPRHTHLLALYAPCRLSWSGCVYFSFCMAACQLQHSHLLSYQDTSQQSYQDTSQQSYQGSSQQSYQDTSQQSYQDTIVNSHTRTL